MGSQGTQPQPEKKCEQKAHLIDNYAAATNEYNRVVKLLRLKLGTSPKAEYDQLQLLTEQTRLRRDAARLALYRHISDHGC